MLKEWKSKFFASPLLSQIIIINVALFLLINLTNIILRLMGQNPSEFLVHYLSASSDFGAMLFRPWGVISYQFTHEGLWHLAMNMLVFYFAGQIFTSMLGSKKLLPLYLLGGCTGWLMYALAFNLFPVFPAGDIPIIGASASVMAIVVATATYFPNYTVYLFGVFKVPLKWIAAVYVLLDVLALQGNSNLGGHLSHLGGAAFGYYYSLQLKKGKDLGLVVQALFAAIASIFKPKSPLKAQRGGRYKKSKSSHTKKTSNPRQAKEKDQALIDKILDKISKNGYDSLSEEEKNILFNASK